ncbi:MAG: hypothetical protein OXI67_09590 [Candidatus Poribacteria bacterium]|nr:hypothetical protein [Candidatus Poribacteria bacterium]
MFCKRAYLIGVITSALHAFETGRQVLQPIGLEYWYLHLPIAASVDDVHPGRSVQRSVFYLRVIHLDF